jgi:flagellar assembly protein FliH
MSDLAAALAMPSGGFRADSRFAGAIGADLQMHRPNGAETAYADGYGKGFEEGVGQALAQADLNAAARGKIELGLGRLAEQEEQRFEERLRETVLALCETTLAPLTADPDILATRVTNALGLLRRSEDERTLRMHPDDLALLTGRLPDHVRVEPDPALERGALRIETAEGGIEDGPGEWRRVLSEALGL